MNIQILAPKQQAYVDGAWVEADSGTTFDVLNPATQATIAAVPDMTRAEVARAVDAAHKAQPGWAQTTAKERAAVMRRWFELIMARQEDLARVMTAECGKPLPEAMGEVGFGASFIEWFAEEGKRLYGEVIPSPFPDSRLVTLRQPIGVAAAITPWNFPLAMITRKAGAALAAGCTMVARPAGDTPLTALALAALADEARVPAGVFNVVTTARGSTAGAEFCENPLVRKLSFTGSTGVVKKLIEQSAATLTKVSMELGGNAPFIVFDDADLDAAVEGAMVSKYRNTGQTCVCTNRFLVQSAVYDAFVEKFSAAVGGLQVGNGMDDGVSQGPLINVSGLEKVEAIVNDAVAKGGRTVAGGKRHTLGGTFFEPTVVADATTEMAIAREEVFGPVAPVFRFETEQEAIAMANDTEFGLAAYLYTRDMGRSWRVGEALEYGMVAVNAGLISTEVAPFGGVKESGMGREGSRHGIEDYTEIKYLRFAGI